jgi:DNA-binding MarR family transcriptional regulator
MRAHSFRFFKPTREIREMLVLAEIGRDSAVSQRALARTAGVSATMINAYIDGLVGLGYVDVSGETNRTYRYHLTPAGAARRDELTGAVSAELDTLCARVRQELARCAPEPVPAPPAPGAEAA